MTITTLSPIHPTPPPPLKITDVEGYAPLAFVTGHCAFIEYLPPQLCHERLRRELAHEELQLLPDGTIPLPQQPGLGVEIDWDVVQRYRVA